jgi:hypothetical protein
MLRLATALFLSLLMLPASAADNHYDLLYRAQIQPETGLARVEISLRGETLPRELTLNLSSGRYRDLHSKQPLEIDSDEAVWHPQGTESKLSYLFVINNKKGSGSYDSRITEDWAILRSDKLIPSISALAERRLRSRAVLQFDLPEGWSAAAPYPKNEDGSFALSDPGRRFVRPKGWLIVGKIGSRQDIIAGVNTMVSAPLEQNIRRQDTLAFLNWNLPELKKIFPKFPNKLLIVMAGDPMWRGALSGTRSLFMHADRPLISGNRTSSLVHELVHVGTGIHGDHESDWIVEGLAEFYSLEIPRRSGGISERRYDESMDKLISWGRQAPSLLVKRSSGPVTARAVGVMRNVDRQIRKGSGGKASLDTVAGALARERGQVSLQRFRQLAEEAAGKPIPALEREKLEKPAGKKKP